MEKRKRGKALWIITIISFAMSVIMFGAFVFGLTNDSDSDTDKVGSYDWAIGTVDTETGKLLESKKSVYTKDMQTVEGLEITVAEDATITYKVVFYDENEDFVSATDALSADFDATTVPEAAEYFRVVITPLQVDSEDVELTVWNMGKYYKQLEISYSK